MARIHTSTMQNKYRCLVHGGTVVVRESSSVKKREGEPVNPGSYYLWIAGAHMDGESIEELIACLQYWLDDGRLPEIPEEGVAE